MFVYVQVGFGEVNVREHQRAVGHGNVTSDGGPALGIDSKVRVLCIFLTFTIQTHKRSHTHTRPILSQYADRLMRRLSSYENLRAAVRVPRQEFMKSGYKGPEGEFRTATSAFVFSFLF